jgi:hypothetical protein
MFRHRVKIFLVEVNRTSASVRAPWSESVTKQEKIILLWLDSSARAAQQPTEDEAEHQAAHESSFEAIKKSLSDAIQVQI